MRSSRFRNSLREDPGTANVLDIADHAFGFAAKFGAAAFEAAIEFVEAVFGLFDVGGKRLRRVAALLHLEQIGQAQILAVNQLIETDFEVFGNCFRFFGALGGHFGKHRVERVLDEKLLRGGVVRKAGAAGGGGAFGGDSQIEQNGGLLY